MASIAPRDTFLEAALVLAAYRWGSLPAMYRGKEPRDQNRTSRRRSAARQVPRRDMRPGRARHV